MPDRSSGLRRLLASALLALLAAGCGFQPLYGDRAGSTEVAELEKILIRPIPERTGQELHNALRNRLNPTGQPGDPRYQLSIRLNERMEQTNFRGDATASRVTLTLIASYRLGDYDSGSQLFAGRSRAFSSYDVLGSPYATTVEERSARRRAAENLAEDISRRVAAFLSRSGDGGT